MLLVIDIGNTDIVGGLYRAGGLVSSFRLRSQARRTEDEYSAGFLAHLAERGVAATEIEQVVISSVVPALTPTIRQLCLRLFGREALVLGPDFWPRLPLELPSPREIGSDLVANALAAHRRFARDCLVVDFGTALTFTALRGGGKVLGVTIAPGLCTAIESLTRHTAQLPEVELVPPASVIGTDTVMSIQAGVLHGYAGLVEHLCAAISKEMGGRVHVVATGGLCKVIAPLVSCFDLIDQGLTLDGLAFAAEYA